MIDKAALWRRLDPDGTIPPLLEHVRQTNDDSMLGEGEDGFWYAYETVFQNRLRFCFGNEYRRFCEITRQPPAERLLVFLSGGVDSSVSLVFALRFAATMGWSSDKIMAFHFVRNAPYPAENGDRDYAEALCRACELPLRTVDVTPVLDGLAKVCAPCLGAEVLTDERINRARTIAAHTMADIEGGVAFSCGNLSEYLLCQWTTGAYTGHFGVTTCLLKTEVYALAEHLVRHLPAFCGPASEVLGQIVRRPKVTSELRGGAVGARNREEYASVDRILYRYLVDALTESEAEEYRQVLARVECHRLRDHGDSPVVELSGNRLNPPSAYRVERDITPLARLIDACRRARYLDG